MKRGCDSQDSEPGHDTDFSISPWRGARQDSEPGHDTTSKRPTTIGNSYVSEVWFERDIQTDQDSCETCSHTDQRRWLIECSDLWNAWHPRWYSCSTTINEFLQHYRLADTSSRTCRNEKRSSALGSDCEPSLRSYNVHHDVSPFLYFHYVYICCYNRHTGCEDSEPVEIICTLSQIGFIRRHTHHHYHFGCHG